MSNIRFLLYISDDLAAIAAAYMILTILNLIYKPDIKLPTFFIYTANESYSEFSIFLFLDNIVCSDIIIAILSSGRFVNPNPACLCLAVSNKTKTS